MADSEIIVEDKDNQRDDSDSRDEELDEPPAKSTDDNTHDGGVGFCIVENGTICGRRKLIDTRGYTYNVRRVKDSRTYWWCSVRNRTMYCKASVIQLGEVFRLGSKEHCHEPKPEVKAKKKRKRAKNETTKTEEKKCLGLEEQTDGAASQPECHTIVQKKKLKQNLNKKSSDVKYRIINEGTRCGKRKLVDSLGYEYNIKCIKNNITYWWCAVRNKTTHCRAAVSQRGDKFKMGMNEHCHEAVFKPKMKLAETEEAPTSSIIERDEQDNFELPGESLTFHVFSNMTKNSAVTLVDSEGFTYKLKRQKEDQAYWICGEQGKSTSKRCSATVSQRGNKFRFGKVEHCHKPTALPELREAYVGTRNCAAFSVNEVVAECLDLEMLDGSNPDKAQEDDSDEDDDRVPVKEREKRRDINTQYIPPHFLQKDIRIDNEQHLVLAFKEQVDLLSKAQVWYLDTAVRLVSEPFVQLFTITTCIQSGEEIRHVPLAFILMSRCQRVDYLKVFEFIKEILPHPLVVNTFVASVDEALWEAVAKVFPDRKLHGCPYQWGKVIWQKVEEFGLEAEYYEEDRSACIINSILALPFLPYEHIELAFRHIRDQTRGLRQFESLLDYIEITWISNSSWNLSFWSTFMQPVRTRSDIESWHVAMPFQNGKPTFYGLMWQLLQEAKLVPVQVQIICDEKLSSYQRNSTGTIQKQFYYLWDMYSAGNLATSSFLEEIGMVCSHVNK